MKAALIILAIIALTVLGVFTWIAFQPPPPAPVVFFRFAGYTNDATGGRLAMFTVSNLGAYKVFRAPHRAYQLQSPTAWTFEWATSLPSGATLDAGGSEMVTFVPPTNRAVWKASLVFTPRDSSGEKFKWGGR